MTQNVISGNQYPPSEIEIADISSGSTDDGLPLVADGSGSVEYGRGGNVQIVADAAATLSLDANVYSCVDATLTEDCTIALAGLTLGGDQHTMSMKARQDGIGGWDITWGANIDWDADTDPAPDTTLDTYALYVFTTIDGGTTWIGAMSGSGMPV